MDANKYNDIMTARLSEIDNRNDVIYDILVNRTNDELVRLHNGTYAEDYPDEMIFLNNEYEFNEIVGREQTPWEVIEQLEGCPYKTSDDYFAFDGQGNIKSFDDVAEYISIHDLADYIERNDGEGIEEDWVDEEDVKWVFANKFERAKELTEEEIDDIDIMDLITNDWDTVVNDVISFRD